MKKAIIKAETGDMIECLFNPEKYSITKKNQWKKSKADKKKSAPQLEFTGGGSEKLKVKLFFDTTESGVDVTTHTKRVFNLMKVQGEEPPKCTFSWGSYTSPRSVITNIKQNFLMFAPNGNPLRAELTVTFEELTYRQKSQNPTSVGVSRHTRVVQGGDRIDLIAYEELGDSTRWPEIAKLNELINPMGLQPGDILQIPSD